MEHELAEVSALLRELALTDELTGLHNRRGFVAAGSQLLALADRQQVTTALLFLDLDNLKLLNDDRGHSAGDAALRAVAQALGEVLRRADTSARIGGDEFAALAFGVDAAGREVIDRRIHDYLGGPQAVAAVGRAVEVSIGWATRSPGQSTTVEDLLSAADAVMYQAKAGKDKRPRATPGE
jgi:diguanylate cyclase (GGDEF)-like protein